MILEVCLLVVNALVLAAVWKKRRAPPNKELEEKFEQLRQLCIKYDAETEESLNQLAKRIGKLEDLNTGGIFSRKKP